MIRDQPCYRYIREAPSETFFPLVTRNPSGKKQLAPPLPFFVRPLVCRHYIGPFGVCVYYPRVCGGDSHAIHLTPPLLFHFPPISDSN